MTGGATFISLWPIPQAMSGRLYHSQPHLKEFTAIVTVTDGDWVSLDSTAFYPGGGGQSADSGSIAGLPVTGMRNGDPPWHLIKGHSLKIGDVVEAALDWDRRWQLMRSHTGEHLLASTLKSIVPDIGIVKVDLRMDINSLYVNGDLKWSDLSKAQGLCNEIIASDIPVTVSLVSKDDPILDGVRIKRERIKGDAVRLVSIEGLDRVACAGVHVDSTGKIGAVLVDRLASGGGEGYMVINFSVGEAAVSSGLARGAVAAHAAHVLGAEVKDLPRSVSNLKNTADSRWQALKACNQRILDQLQPEDIGGVPVYCGSFSGLDRKTLNAKADQLRQGGICIMASIEDKLSLVVACDPIFDLDCQEVLGSALAECGGRGGGQSDFAAGGCQSPEAIDHVLAKCMEYVGNWVTSRDL